MSLALLLLVAGAAAASTAHPRPPRSVARAGKHAAATADDCKAGLCGGMARYAVAPGMRFYSTFNVPGLPLNQSAIDNDITFFIYQNIYFDGGPGECEQCKMNQFVNQLMLGNPLYGSTGPPRYDPEWMQVPTWIFAAQYFMEVYNNNTAKAAAGPWYNCTSGEVLWTEYALDEVAGGEWAWTLSMGVVGDASRTSSIVAAQPFMGLLVANGTSSWKEPAYSSAFYNGCWELYGVAPYGGTHYPSSSSVYDMRTQLGPSQAPIKWQLEWSDVEWATCPNHPNGTFTEIHNATQQDVGWLIFFPPHCEAGGPCVS